MKPTREHASVVRCPDCGSEEVDWVERKTQLKNIHHEVGAPEDAKPLVYTHPESAKNVFQCRACGYAWRCPEWWNGTLREVKPAVIRPPLGKVPLLPFTEVQIVAPLTSFHECLGVTKHVGATAAMVQLHGRSDELAFFLTELRTTGRTQAQIVAHTATGHVTVNEAQAEGRLRRAGSRKKLKVEHACMTRRCPNCGGLTDTDRPDGFCPECNEEHTRDFCPEEALRPGDICIWNGGPWVRIRGKYAMPPDLSFELLSHEPGRIELDDPVRLRKVVPGDLILYRPLNETYRIVDLARDPDMMLVETLAGFSVAAGIPYGQAELVTEPPPERIAVGDWVEHTRSDGTTSTALVDGFDHVSWAQGRIVSGGTLDEYATTLSPARLRKVDPPQYSGWDKDLHGDPRIVPGATVLFCEPRFSEVGCKWDIRETHRERIDAQLGSVRAVEKVFRCDDPQWFDVPFTAIKVLSGYHGWPARDCIFISGPEKE